MNSWKLTYNEFIPEEEKLREALCTLGNGYIGTRGAAVEVNASKHHYPGTYLAGGFNRLDSPVGNRMVTNEDFVNCPNWLPLKYRIGQGRWFEYRRAAVRTDRSEKFLSYRQELDMKNGVLKKRIRWQDDKGRITRMESERLVSMAQPHYGAMHYTITPENYSGTITVQSGLDGRLLNAGVERYKTLNQKHLKPMALGVCGNDDKGIYLQMRMVQSLVEITETAQTRVFCGKQELAVKKKVIKKGKKSISHQFTLKVKKGRSYRIEKIATLYSSRDIGVSHNHRAAVYALNMADRYRDLLVPHRAKWHALWKRFDIEVAGDPLAQQVLRLHIFHLLASASSNNEDIDAGLAARGLHGEAYRGHIFWDVTYVLPFYTFHAPEISRALLMYRYRRLPAARKHARAHGYKGAMYPWQSGSSGREETQVVHLNPLSGKWGDDYSCLQRHVNIAIAYDIWNYYRISGDYDFLVRYGAEMFLDIARFWSSLAAYNSKKKRYEIKGVMGPDEFHEKNPGAKKGGINNNAYTNVMVVWIMDRVSDILQMIPAEEQEALVGKIGLTEAEIRRFHDISRRMFLAIDKDGLLHQFEGYMKLKEIDWDYYGNKYGNIHRMDRILKAEGKSPDEYKVAKQADTLMLFYLLEQEDLRTIFRRLGYPFPKNSMKINYDYYIKHTSHGSTLSKVVHSFIAYKMGDETLAMGLYDEVLRSDIHDTQGGTTPEGIHAGVMGGSVDMVVRGFAGLEVHEDRICFSPRLPRGWRRIKFQIRYRNRWLRIDLQEKKMSIAIEPSPLKTAEAAVKIPIRVNGKTYRVAPGRRQVIVL